MIKNRNYLKMEMIKQGGEKHMTNNELGILLDSLLALLETDNNERAIAVIKNAIQRIDKNTLNNIETENKTK